ncbi:MAG: AAA family ATPase [Bacteroidales bacterium]|nr:AAA family ATPase [Bacteroidales bacterium]
MQKQEVTILSAQFSGFLNLVDGLSSEEISKLMNETHSIIENTIRLHQGNINRFTGDIFLAVFYLNKAGSSASINAVDAVFELKERLDSFIREKKLPSAFVIKIGVAMGTVLSGDIGSENKKQETIMGEAVNHANRICRFAGEGQILVDENTHEVVRDNCEFQILEPIPLKGSERTLGVFELLGKKWIKLKPEEFSERRITSEMVGRNREMELIEIHVKKLMAGEGSVVNIVGKAGIGKSRLIDEIKIQPLLKKIALLEGRAQSIGKNLSFHPIVHIIKSWAGITEEDTPVISSDKLQRSIIRLAKEQADEIFPFLATMMGMPLKGKHKERVAGIEGEALEKLILKNLRDLITAAAAIRPLIILIEDLHWADTSSITFLESLFKLVQKTQILFINVFRPGHEDTGDYILGFLNENLPEDYITIKIDPLIETEARELIGNLLHRTSLPAEVCEMIIRKTEGNPFFIEEVIRSFIDDGIVEIKNNEFFITEKIHKANIPESINEVILSRVDKLDEKTKDLLKTASVIGRNFYYKVLEEAADTIGELDDRIEYLKDVQLIGESKKKEEIEFLFKHALAQQATYESIIQNTKKELHLKIARSIEKVFTENLHEHYGSLAYHYGKAENTEKTEEYLVKAGDEALKSGAASEAISNYKRALAIINEQNNSSDKIHRLEEKLVFAYSAKGMDREVVELTGRILPRYNYHLQEHKKGEKLILLWLAVRFVFMLKRFERIPKRTPTAEEKFVMSMFYIRVPSMVVINPTRYLIELFYYILAYQKIDFSKMRFGYSYLALTISFFTWAGFSPRIGEKVIKLTKKYHNPENKISWSPIKSHEMLHNGLVGNWQPDDGEQEQFLKLCAEHGQFFQASLYGAFRIYSDIELGSYESAQHTINSLLDIAQKYENNAALGYAIRMQTLFDLKFRKIESVKEIEEEVSAFIKRSPDSGIVFALQCSMAQLYALNGEVDLATEMINYAQKSLPQMARAKIWKSKFYLARSFIYLTLANKNEKDIKKRAHFLKEGLRSSKTAVKASKKIALKTVEANRLHSIILWKIGNNKAAYKSFDKTIGIGEKLKAKLEVSRTYLETGKFLSDPLVKYNELNGNPANYYLNKAKTLFEEMDLQWDLVEHQKFVNNR